MRLHRFYVNETLEGQTQVTIHSTELVHQIRRVFRLREGDSVILFNGTQFDYVCKIDGFGDESKLSDTTVIHFRVTATERSRSSSQQQLFLCAALTKKDTFEWIVEKATELGVTDIIPVIAERSEKKSLNAERLKKIAIEASEQSGRATIPMVHDIMGLEDVAEFLKQRGVFPKQHIVFHTEGDVFNRSNIDVSLPLAVYIGPEGGWSVKELKYFHTQNISVACLGPQVLRAETAVVATLSQVVFGR